MKWLPKGTEQTRDSRPANTVDATYRADLRDLNETNFVRFDAKLEQRFAQLDATWFVRWAELDAKIAALGDTLRKELAQSQGELKSSLLKWMFGFWVTTALTLAGLVSGLIPTR